MADSATRVQDDAGSIGALNTSGEERRTPLALVLGESGAGKTHFVIQLLGRLNRQRGRFGIRGAAPDLALLEDAIRRLNRGLTAAHTPSGEYREVLLPLTDRESGAPIDILWPDYAGEQVTQIITEREVPILWRERVLAADAWLLFVRIQHLRDAEDALSRPLGGTAEGHASPSATAAASHNVGDSGEVHWLDQARLVELLQLLLFARRQGPRRAVASPRLVVLLTCWDEITGVPMPKHDSDGMGASGETARPDAVLAARAPLLAQFIAANWTRESLAVLGVSALSRPLHADEPDEDFADVGPEAFGYVVREDGATTHDLTWPLVSLLPSRLVTSSGSL